jgi:transposase-like protein
MDNALRCPQFHSFSRRIVQLIELKDREERRRLSWIAAYRERPDAGAVCRRFCISRPTLRKWLRRYEAQGEVGLRALSRRPHHFPAQKVDEALQAAILDLRRSRRLGAKRLRNELHRLMACGFRGDGSQSARAARTQCSADTQTHTSQAETLQPAGTR